VEISGQLTGLSHQLGRKKAMVQGNVPEEAAEEDFDDEYDTDKKNTYPNMRPPIGADLNRSASFASNNLQHLIQKGVREGAQIASGGQTRCWDDQQRSVDQIVVRPGRTPP